MGLSYHESAASAKGCLRTLIDIPELSLLERRLLLLRLFSVSSSCCGTRWF